MALQVCATLVNLPQCEGNSVGGCRFGGVVDLHKNFRTGSVRRSRRNGQRRSPVALARSSENKPPGNKESKAVLDAFFLGKAFAETLNERLGTALGEFLSDIGRQQAEQQKRLQEFQEEVQERAVKAESKAAQQALAVERAKRESPSPSSFSSSRPVSLDSPETSSFRVE